MNEQSTHTIEEFFLLFHESFLNWAQDLETLCDQRRFQPTPSKAYSDTLILKYSAQVEKLCGLLSREYATLYKQPLPRGVKSAEELREIFRRMRVAATGVVSSGSVSRAQCGMGARIEALTKIDLDDVLRGEKFH